MAFTEKLERMEKIEGVLEKFVDAERLRGIMLVWEVVEDNWQMFKDRISSLFGNGERRSNARDIVAKVKKLLAEKGKSLDGQKEEEIELIAENIAGKSLDFTSYMVIKGALRSRLSGDNGRAKPYEKPLTAEEFEGLVRALVLIVFNTFKNIEENLDDLKKKGTDAGADFWNGPAQSIANVLSLPVWNVLVVQKPNLIRTLRHIVFFLSKPYHGFLQLIEQNMKGSDEMKEALFLDYDTRREAKGVAELGDDADEKSMTALYAAEQIDANKEDIERARTEARTMLQNMLGNAYEAVRGRMEEITGLGALKKEPVILLQECLRILQAQGITAAPEEVASLKLLLTGISGAAIDFALVPETMQRAVRNVEKGGIRGEGQDPAEPLTEGQIEGLTQNAAQVLFNTQLNTVDILRSDSTTDKEFDKNAMAIASQLSRPRWRSVLAQAPEVIYLLRTAVGYFPRSFQNRIRSALREKSGNDTGLDSVFFGNYPFETAMQMAA